MSRRRTIALQRAYAEPGARDGYRALVDRYWPRGRGKDALALDEWARDLAPTPELIRWYDHRGDRWPAFRERYRAELEAPTQRERLRALLASAGRERITLIYGARSETGNQAIVLREALLALDEPPSR